MQMTMQNFILFGLGIFAFCVFVAIYRLRQKVKQRREQIIKEMEAASRERTDAAAADVAIATSFADIGLGKPPEVHDLLSQLDMEQQALKKAKFDKIIEAEARRKEKLTAEAQKQAMEEVMRESRINVYQKVNERTKEPPAAEKKKSFAKAKENQSEREREERQKQQEQQKTEEKENRDRENENQRKEQEDETRRNEQERQKEADKIQELRGVKESENTAAKSTAAEHSNTNANAAAQNAGGHSGGR